MIILKGPNFRESRSFKRRHNFMTIMNSVEEYARRCTKYEGEELDTLSVHIRTFQFKIASRNVVKSKFVILYLKYKKAKLTLCQT